MVTNPQHRPIQFASPRDNPLSYPGERPLSSYLLADGQIHSLRFLSSSSQEPYAVAQHIEVIQPLGESRASLEEQLDRLQAAPLHQRYAVIGYGSNAVPGQLLKKFGTEAIVPVLLGHLSGCDVVYNLVSNFGYAFAELVFDPRFGGCEVGITFLDEVQLALMIESEQNYVLAHVPSDARLPGGQSLRGGAQRPLYFFAGFRKIWVPEGEGGPIAVAEIASDARALTALSQYDYLSLAIKQFALDQFDIHDPEDFSSKLQVQANWPEQPGKLKFEIQRRVDVDPRSFRPSADSVVTLDLNDVPAKWGGCD